MSLTSVRGILSKPYILKISSTISASPSISGLKLGTVISKILFFSTILKPRDSKIDFCLSLLISKPPRDLTLFVLKFILDCLLSKTLVLTESLTSPPHKSVIIFVAASTPHSIDVASIPLSNLYLASL